MNCICTAHKKNDNKRKGVKKGHIELNIDPEIPEGDEGVRGEVPPYCTLCRFIMSQQLSKKKGRIFMNWKNMSTVQKIATVISWIAVVIGLLPYVVGEDLFPVNPTYPAIAVFTLCEAVVSWEKRRKWACLYIAGTVIMMACFVLELIYL